jgi:hypothetical protein
MRNEKLKWINEKWAAHRNTPQIVAAHSSTVHGYYTPCSAARISHLSFFISHFSFLIPHLRRFSLLIPCLCFTLFNSTAKAQQFFNLTAEEVKIDSVLPVFTHVYELNGNYADSVYSISIEYPEFYDMSAADIARYQHIDGSPLPSLPVVKSHVGTSRRQGRLYVSMMPLVMRDGKYQKLVSFKLKVKATGASGAAGSRQPQPSHTTRSTEGGQRYADHSVLSTGQWAKISVPETGVYQITEALVRQAGFRNLSKVKIYGYGGALQPETLTGDYLAATDDLQEVPTYTTANGRRLFHAIGPVTWQSPEATTRTRNPYSTHGYYFLTENDDEPLTVDSAAFVGAFYPTNNDYHSLYEVDDFAWYHSGRNLYDSRLITSSPYSCTLPAHTTDGILTVVLSSAGIGKVDVTLNDSLLGSVAFRTAPSTHDKAVITTTSYNIEGLLRENNTVKLTQSEGTVEMRLDHITLTMPAPAAPPDLTSASLPTPRYVYRITNQDHHADPQADMVIIIPTSQVFADQAQRLKELHEQKDSLRVTIVPADELINEFASGTPDANAYRRYMKMLYDRAETEADMPRYLLLFGDGAWDNRMLTAKWRTASPDDYLLCYESENSVSETDSYVSDDYFCLLDDGEGGKLTVSDVADVGVGRLPATTDSEAKILVDKIVGYRNNDYAGDWQNVVCFLGDDGNNNVHMREADDAAKLVEQNYPGYDVKRIFWDAYHRVTTSTGNHYPEVESLVKQQMKNGALIIDYCGHGAAYSISHEKVLLLNDFATQTSLRLPLWVTASCDIMPYESGDDNIGETAMFNTKGGCIAFYGTTRTVWTGANRDMNCGFIKHALATVDGRRNTLGDAVRLTKAETWGSQNTLYNKLHYTLLGDPALTLAAPTERVVIDSINGLVTGKDTIQLATNATVTVTGHIENHPAYEGIVALTLKDVMSAVTCQVNNALEDGAQTPFVFNDRLNTLAKGTDSIRGGRFTVTVALPRDISYSDATNLLVTYAISSDRQLTAHGQNSQLCVNKSLEASNDGIGPSIYCFLNSRNFTNGGEVNATPYFYAELSDKDGINCTGSGIGHDMELVIDGEMDKTYNLNNYFQFDFGNYRSGSVGFSIPDLSEGEHSLAFRAWDILNNSSLAELKFKVVKGLTPQCFDVACTRNPATTSTSFVVSHDRAGSDIDVVLQVFDTSGRQLWEHAETGVSTDTTYTLNWDLTVDSGSRLRTGVYLYRVLVSSEGAVKASKAKKLIIL